MEIIDFHTHTFEDYVAFRAVDKLRRSANILNYADGTDGNLIELNKSEKIGLSVVLPVATKIMQGQDINARNHKKNEHTAETGLMYFAAIHPDDSNIPAKLSDIKNAGFKGIKIHPVFQDVYADESSYLKMIDIASEIGLITVIHAGEDLTHPDCEWAGVRYILNMLNQVHPKNVVLAHMGGLNEWDLVESDLAGADVYFDTSFSLNEIKSFDLAKPTKKDCLSKEQFLRIVKKHGVDKILFGTDSPWTSRTESIKCIQDTGLDEMSLEMIFSKNAKKILNI